MSKPITTETFINTFFIKAEDGGYTVNKMVISSNGKVKSVVRVSEPDLFALSLEVLKQNVRRDLGI